MAKGKVKLYTGPMGSGKTESLIQEYLHDEGEKMMIKSTVDQRDPSDNVMSRLGTLVKGIRVTELMKEVPSLKPGMTVYIDEGQFFNDLKSFVVYAQWSKTNVVIAALDETFKCELWDPIAQLYAHKFAKGTFEIKKLTAECYTQGCLNPAVHTKRTSSSTELIAVGYDYVASCSECFDVLIPVNN